jgi:hypothetical protein
MTKEAISLREPITETGFTPHIAHAFFEIALITARCFYIGKGLA